MSARVAAIVVNYDQTGVSLRCLASLRAAHYPDLVTILVDNASPRDPTTAICATFPDTEIVRLAENRGYAGGCNAGARRALDLGAEYLLFLNNDATIEPDAIVRLIGAAVTYPSSILAPKIVYAHDASRVWWAGGELRWPWMENRHLGQGEPAEAHVADRSCDWASGCALFVPLSVYRRLGPLDESYYLYLEDVDWSVRAMKAGIGVTLVGRAVVRHEVSSSTRLLPAPHVLYYGCRNTYRLALRHNSGPARVRVAVGLAVSLGKAIGRNLFYPSRRRDPLYRARTRALVDAALGRSGAFAAQS